MRSMRALGALGRVSQVHGLLRAALRAPGLRCRQSPWLGHGSLLRQLTPRKTLAALALSRGPRKDFGVAEARWTNKESVAPAPGDARTRSTGHPRRTSGGNH